MNRTGYFISLTLLLLTVLYGCRKFDDTSGEGRLSFSTDTITFDTVFTTIGSATLSFKIYNHGSGTMHLNSISLAGGSHSFFRLNIDGEAVPMLSNVDIPKDDSLFIFVAVTIDPLNADNPLVVKDSILFDHDGMISDVKLIAYGQDVNLINGRILQSVTWTRN